MTQQQEQDMLRYVHTHGKQARCWHVTEDGGWGECEKCDVIFYGVGSNPTLTIDYLIQRCVEELFWVDTRMRLECPNKKYRAWAQVNGDPSGIGTESYADTPQHALLIALAKALGFNQAS